MLTQTPNFLQQLALQTQVLANLQWLCEFQVLACVPLEGSVALAEVADITSVPVDQLQRVVRLMITAGFLCEPSSGQVAHTLLSASFVTEPAFLDAALFLAQTAAPAAFKMPLAAGGSAAGTAAGAAAPTAGRPFSVASSDHDRPSQWTVDASPVALDYAQPKIQRQFAAYLEHGILDEPAAINEVLQLVDWSRHGSGRVVDVHPPSMTTATTLAALAPAVQVIVQTPSSSSFPADAATDGLLAHVDGFGGSSWTAYDAPASVASRISVQPRTAGTTQTILGAAIYLLRLPSPSPLVSWAMVRSQTSLELQSHLPVLRAQPSSRLLLTALVLHSPGIVNRETEALVRLRDLSLLQLFNDRLPSKLDIIELLTTTRDQGGGLVLSNEIYSPTSAVMAFEVRYQSYSDQGSSRGE